MSVREHLERREADWLSPFASRSADTKGRARPISPDQLRTEYQRDRDRIIHSKAFRRLQFKTQVFLAPEGDHFRTRLTHTLEVAQVARTIARALRLNEDLTEAIALGHDLGHTPFGHIGERTLNRLNPEGFRHNEQSLRVVEHLEGGQGLNLTWEVREGIRNHSGVSKGATLEAHVVAKADRIAYINHDIDDALRAGIIRLEDLPEEPLAVLGQSHGERIATMISDLVQQSEGKPQVQNSAAVQAATDSLRGFLFKRVYQDSWRKEEERKCDHVLSCLHEHFLAEPGEMPAEYQLIAEREGVPRAVCDYLASMTDRFALRSFHLRFVPTSFPAQ